MISEPRLRMARKAHRCNWCAEMILANTRYQRQFHVCEGSAWASKLHVECDLAFMAYKDQDDLFLDGQFQRGHVHEPDFYSVEAGVADGCPGCIALKQPKETECPPTSPP